MRNLEAYYLKVMFLPPALALSRRWTPEGESVTDLHTWYRGHTRRILGEEPVWKRIVMFALCPFITFMTLVWVLCVNGRTIKRRSGRGILAQAWDQARLAIRRGVPPPWYYVFELYRPELREQAGRYLLRYHLKGGIYAALRRYSGARGDKTLNDKLRFFEFCREHDLRTAEVACEVAEGEVRWVPPATTLGERSVFAKPRRSRGGRGTERWLWEDGRYTNGSRTFDHDGLLDHFRELSRVQPYLLQERLVNHPEVLEMTAGALTSVRVLVCCDERWQPEVVHAYMRMNCDPDKIVDNVHAGGLAAPVDIATGRLGRATNLGMSPRVGWVDEHPVTGARITGYQVPAWEQTKELALRAHRELGVFCIAGWDIGILADGPCLVEGNHGPCVDSTQRMLLRPIGNERYGQLIRFHLARAEAGQGPPRPALETCPDRRLGEDDAGESAS